MSDWGNDQLFQFAMRQQNMSHEPLLDRVRIDPEICAGRPYIRGTRIYIAIILDALTEDLTPPEIIAHYPCLDLDDIRAAVAYASQLAHDNGGVALLNNNSSESFQLR